MISTKTKSSKVLPLVYGCSGCSNVGQLANHLALKLHREHIARMSCIVGVGGDVPQLVRKALMAQKIVAIDGCPVHCVKKCLARQSVEPHWHYTLSTFDITKREHEECSPEELQRVFRNIVDDINGHTEAT
jgi:uncharacterized metal-binding protein